MKLNFGGEKFDKKTVFNLQTRLIKNENHINFIETLIRVSKFN